MKILVKIREGTNREKNVCKIYFKVLKKLFAEYKNLIIFGEEMCWKICWLCALNLFQ